MRLFGRIAKVTVVALQPDSFTRAAGNMVEIDSLRIRFEVKKGLGKEPNKCVVKLTNLNATDRALIERKPLRVILQAGYDGAPRLLFDGDMKRAWSEHEGKADIVTEIHVGDSARSYAHARVDRSYRPPTTLLQVVRDAAASMELPVPPEVLRSDVFRQSLPSGLTAGLPTRELLTRVLTPLGFSWSSQNGKLTILREGEVREGQEYVVNQSTGLVNSPKFKESENAGKGTKTEIQFVTMLFPELEPGRAVRVESQFLNQRVKITDSTSKGDTESTGADWVTECKGRPIP